MFRNKKKEKTTAVQVQRPEQFIPESIVADLRTCFQYYDKNRRGEINRDNLKSIMENFGWLNRPVKEIEGCIDQVFPSVHEDKRRKEVFNFEEVLELIADYWIKRGFLENEFSEMFAIFDKK